VILSLAALAACSRADTPATSAAAAPGAEAITEAGLRSDLFALADDSLRGRLVGTPEIERAAEWIRDRFAAEGLEPAGDAGTYDQRFDLVWFSLGTDNGIEVNGAAHAPGDGWYPLNFSATTSETCDVVFAGFRIVETGLGRDDYHGADVRGKLDIELERETGAHDHASPFDGVVTAESSRDWR
jgi:hypothetical protein